ncbi:hypothetical protein [Paraburkholderia dipogonis]|uniref:hypothetical protein n=1 Tax=Paraburkholderia dipogonis TaxID=1211383 RepID=UPI0038BE0226
MAVLHCTTIERNDALEAVQCLSAHELAMLLVLLQAPCDVMAATPDVMALLEAGLAQLVDSGQGKARFAITDEGNAVLRVLDTG